MKKFNLLIIGNANHQYILNFSKWLKTVFPNISISIISTNPNTPEDFKNRVYDKIYPAFSDSHFILKLKGLRGFYRAWKVNRIIQTQNLGNDAILIHFADPWLGIISRQIKKKTKNLTIALWGSDFYRVKYKKYLEEILHHSDNIIIGTPQMIKDFKEEFGKYFHKVHLCYFGNEPIEHLKKIKENAVTRQQSCNLFNLSNSKLNVTIGHSGTKAHRHIPVINELAKLNGKVANKIRIILPMTYELNPEYLEEIKEVCDKTNIEFRIFTEFMTEREVAHLRNLTDIMINLQTTDALSGSMREVLFCGGIIINGSWLPYDFLKQKGIYYEEISSIRKISEKVTDIVLKYPYYQKKCKNNSSKIYDISSWSQVIEKWKEVIKMQR